MTAMAIGSWIQRLRPASDAPVVAPQTTGTLDGAGQPYLSVGALQWSARTARELTARVGDVIPALTEGAPQTAALLAGMEAAVLGVLESIGRGRVESSALEFTETDLAERTARELVSEHVPLTDVWASIMQGHARLSAMLMSECERLVPPEAAADELRSMNAVSFEFFNRLTERIARSYAAEHEHRMATAIAIREEAVGILLRGELTDLERLSRSLRYDVAHRHHIAVLLWHDTDGWQQTSLLQSAAQGWLASAGAQQTLVLPQGRTQLWAWGSRSSAFPEDFLGDADPLPEHVRVAVGLPGHGADGFRSSHAQALETARVVSAVGSALHEPVTSYRSVSLLSLVTADTRAVQRFVQLELGDLAADDRYTAEIRTTCRTFLESHSPQATATLLFLARNTVNYRLRRAEELLGRPLTVRQLELWLALYLAETMPNGTERGER